jgi:hypothetical protein
VILVLSSSIGSYLLRGQRVDIGLLLKLVLFDCASVVNRAERV